MYSKYLLIVTALLLFSSCDKQSDLMENQDKLVGNWDVVGSFNGLDGKFVYSIGEMNFSNEGSYTFISIIGEDKNEINGDYELFMGESILDNKDKLMLRLSSLRYNFSIKKDTLAYGLDAFDAGSIVLVKSK